jgi:hypothetical protein
MLPATLAAARPAKNCRRVHSPVITLRILSPFCKKRIREYITSKMLGFLGILRLMGDLARTGINSTYIRSYTSPHRGFGELTQMQLSLCLKIRLSSSC